MSTKQNTKTSKKINNIKTKTRKLAKTISKINKKVNKTIKAPNKKFIPAANTKNLNKDFRILYQDGTTVKVTGRDLVYAIPDNLAQQNQTDIITVIPANPCYWLGTRISALAQGYQNYRPLSMKFSYIPQCAVTQQGNVIAGTLWNQAPSNDNLQQSLRTSNGGQLSQCYKSFTSVVRLKSNLQYNLYKTAGQFDQESNPFIFMSIAVGCKNSNNQNIIPGYYYVTWAFLLKNPIGNTNIFYNSGITTYDHVDKDYENKTIVFLTPGDAEIQRGAILQLEDDDDDQMIAYYNGSVYDMEQTDIVWFFGNSTIQQSNALAKSVKQIIEYEYETTEAQSSTLFTTLMIYEPKSNPNVYRIWIPATHELRAIDFQLSRMKDNNEISRTTPIYFYNTEFYQINPAPQIYFGYFTRFADNPGTYDKAVEFEVNKEDVELVQYDPDRSKQKLRNKKTRRRQQQKQPNNRIKDALVVKLKSHQQQQEECIADFEEDKKLKPSQELLREQGNVEADAHNRQKQASRIDKYLKLNKIGTTKQSRSAKSVFTNTINEEEEQINCGNNS
jgi:hypothetical protein